MADFLGRNRTKLVIRTFSGTVKKATRPTNPLYKKIRVDRFWSASSLSRRSRPVGGLDGNSELQCVSRTHHSESKFLIHPGACPTNGLVQKWADVYGRNRTKVVTSDVFR